MQNSNPEYDWLFEASWEVCNKIGGIYTVLSTKANILQKQNHDKVVFIGPDVWTSENPCPVFKEYKTLLKSAERKLNLPYNIKVRVGRWLVPGNPVAVLVNVGDVPQALPDIYGKMWELYGVDSLHAYGDYSEGCAFGVASAIVIEALVQHLKADPEKCIAHFDEWTTSMGLLYLEHIASRIATVFTTHATSIGRSICSNGKPLYDYFSGYHGDRMASELNMESKHSLEKQAAAHADCFTTVSEVTARECTQLLETTPQVVTPNGFEPDFVPGQVKLEKARKLSREKLIALVSALTGKRISQNALLVATSGRNEYRNKGIDLYIDAMERVRNAHPSRQVVAFILVPAWSSNPQPDLADIMEGRLGTTPEINFISHRLHNEWEDKIFNRLKALDVNKAEDSVFFVYVPCYLDGKDGVLNLAYYDMMPGLDLTVFPSYYEPWGYTPLESIAFGVPTVSTDKAGFGQWILDNFDGTFTDCGAEVVERTDSNYDAACWETAQKVHFISDCDADVCAQISKAAQKTAAKADWSNFIKYYNQAYAVALNRRDKRNK
ncbi:MAG: glycogen/starch synthase [Prevotella sp.]|nr:glycogen/starch synthase [Prevotella sp.]MCM1074273.1 glycogen/starch synthase [Ruminococcus sp.]